MREHVCEVMKSAAGEANELGESFPFGMPATEASLMFLDHGAEKSADKAGNAVGSGKNQSAGYGVALVRHCGGAAATGGGRLEKFGDFGLGVEGDVTRDFTKGAGEEAESGGDFGDAIAVAVPGKRWKGEKKIVGE